MPTYGNYGFGPETKFFDNPLGSPIAFLPGAPVFAPPGATLSPPAPLAPSIDRSYAGAGGDTSGPGPGATNGPDGNAVAGGRLGGKAPGGDMGTPEGLATAVALGLAGPLAAPSVLFGMVDNAMSQAKSTNPQSMPDKALKAFQPAWLRATLSFFGPDDASSVTDPAHAQAIQAAMDADAASPDAPAKDAAAKSSDAAAAVRGALAAIGLSGEDGSDPGMGNPAGPVGADGIGVGNATAGIGFGSIGAGDGGMGGGASGGLGGEGGATAGQGFGSIGAGDGGMGGGGDGDGGGDRVICTELLRQGLLSRDLYLVDVRHGRRFSRTMYRGYHCWAVPYVRVMRRQDLIGRAATAFIQPIVYRRALQLAYVAGKRPRPTWRGLAARVVLESLCWIVGHAAGVTDYRALYEEGNVCRR